MVYGTYNYSYWGESKPTYNWAASHCTRYPDYIPFIAPLYHMVPIELLLSTRKTCCWGSSSHVHGCHIPQVHSNALPFNQWNQTISHYLKYVYVNICNIYIDTPISSGEIPQLFFLPKPNFAKTQGTAACGRCRYCCASANGKGSFRFKRRRSKRWNSWSPSWDGLARRGFLSMGDPPLWHNFGPASIITQLRSNDLVLRDPYFEETPIPLQI